MKINSINDKCYIWIDRNNFYLGICRDLDGNIVKYYCMNTSYHEVEISKKTYTNLLPLINKYSNTYQQLQMKSIDNKESIRVTGRDFYLMNHKTLDGDIINHYCVNYYGDSVEISKADYEKLLPCDDIYEQIKINSIDNRKHLLIFSFRFYLIKSTNLNTNISTYYCRDSYGKRIEVSKSDFNKLLEINSSYTIFKTEP